MNATDACRWSSCRAKCRPAPSRTLFGRAFLSVSGGAVRPRRTRAQSALLQAAPPGQQQRSESHGSRLMPAPAPAPRGRPRRRRCLPRERGSVARSGRPPGELWLRAPPCSAGVAPPRKDHTTAEPAELSRRREAHSAASAAAHTIPPMNWLAEATRHKNAGTRHMDLCWLRTNDRIVNANGQFIKLITQQAHDTGPTHRTLHSRWKRF